MKNKILSFIKNSKISKTKIVLSVFFIALFFFWSTLAQTTQWTNEWLENINFFVEKLIEFFSRSWILIASLAWKFMTNDMVYGSWLHLDAYLWKLRNIFKNFANFGLLGILLRGIIQFINKKWENIQSLITKTLISWILIQASWFLLAAILDVSTILTTAISTLPSHFIDNNAIKSTLVTELWLNMKSHIIKLDKDWKPELEVINDTSPWQAKTIEELVETIMPNSNSVAGPLIYIWATTLKVQDAISQKSNQDKTVKSTVVTSLLQFLILFIYCITLILLLITNIIRIWLLRIIIPLSPILVLLFTMGKEKIFGNKWFAKNFNIGVILHAIFKPVVFAAALWLILIFVVSMQKIMTNNNSSINVQWTNISTKWNVASIENEAMSVTINDTLFSDIKNTGKNIFSGLILYFATIFLLRYIVKIAATMGWWSIGDTMGSVTKFIETAAKQAPLFWWYSSSVLREGKNKALEGFGKWIWVNMDFKWPNAGKFKSDEEFRKKVYNYIHWNNMRLDDEIARLRDSRNFIQDTKNLINTEGKAPLDKSTLEGRETLFNKKLEQRKTWIDEFDEINNRDKFFKNWKLELKELTKDWFKKLHEALWGNSSETVDKYENFQKQIYGNTTK